MYVVAIDPAQDADLAERLLAVQHAAYRVEASLIGDSRIPPLHEDVQDLRQAGLNWIGAFDGVPTRLVGALAWDENADEVDIDRLVVDPAVHRRGAGSALVRAMLSHTGTRRAIVSTGRGNLPAQVLYRGLGFQQLEDTEVEPGLWITHFVRFPHPAVHDPVSGPPVDAHAPSGSSGTSSSVTCSS